MTLSGRTYPVDGPPVALKFTQNVADGVADAADHAACPKPAPNFSPARATPGAGAVGFSTRLQRRVSHGVRCCNQVKAVDAAVGAAHSPLNPRGGFSMGTVL